jgi:hypothetical protein
MKIVITEDPLYLSFFALYVPTYIKCENHFWSFFSHQKGGKIEENCYHGLCASFLI